ncbi:response regulator [Paenibacillus sepulcri]|uniref:response regulator n=1 Tax=Paenibacillus sepulcri TaxID=359917 RepID=UPI001AE7B8CD
MCRVLLVDDEFMARAGLRATFDWEGNGYRLVGEAANGMRAMKWLENGEVDILITDIAMPVMDGLELTRRARELCPWVKVLLLSCHSDFDYVREGIRLGASDYILKPTLNADSLKTILDQMRVKLREEQANRELLEKYRDKQLAEQQEELEKLLIKAVHGNEEACASLIVNLTDIPPRYGMAVLQVHGIKPHSLESEVRLSREIGSMKTLLYERLEAPAAAAIHPDLLIAVIPERILSAGRAEEVVGQAVRGGELADDVYAAGISRLHGDLRELQAAFAEAQQALEDTFFYGPGSIVMAEERPQPACQPLPDHGDIMHLLKEALAVENHSEALLQLKRITGHWSRQFKTKQQVIVEAEQLLSLLMLSKHNNTAMVHHIRKLSKLDFAADIAEHVEACFSSMPVTNDSGIPDTTLHGRIVMQAVQFMTEHFTEAISLQQVADEVNVSRNYFSEMFKKVTGKNFIDYLIALRVNRAKELLAESTLRVYEVAEQSGFNDVKHFSKQFKKIVGLSPGEYHGQPHKPGGQANSGKQDTLSEQNPFS